MSQTIIIQPDAIRPEVIDAIRMIGQVVTFEGEQYKIHAVEGSDFYAFGSKTPGDKTITCDLAMTPGYRPGTYAFLLPMSHKIGEVGGFEVPLARIKRGVSLAKCAV